MSDQLSVEDLAQWVRALLDRAQPVLVGVELLDEILSWEHEKDHRENDCFPTPWDGGCWCGRDNRVRTLLELMLKGATDA